MNNSNETHLNKTYVAFLDVLGFRDLVDNNKHEMLNTIYQNLFSYAVDMGTCLGTYEKTQDKDGENVLMPSIQHSVVNSLLISDSIIYWTDDNSIASLEKIIYALNELLVNSFRVGLPLRGALTCGPLTVKTRQSSSKMMNLESTCFGRSITKAYDKGIKQEWAGCVIDYDCVQEGITQSKNGSYPENFTIFNMLFDIYRVSEYKVPYKSGPVGVEYVINWASHCDVNEPIISKAFSSHNKSINDWKVEVKIKNTLEFFRNMQNPEFDARKPQ